MIIYVFDCQFEVFRNSNAGKKMAELRIYVYVNTAQREKTNLCSGNLSQFFIFF